MMQETYPHAFAFPFQLNETNNQPETGLTKREYFAAMAMQGILAKEAWAERLYSEREHENSHVNNIIIASIKCADALIEKLNK